VRLARSSDRSVPQLARELGVSPQTLTNWIAQDRIDAGEPGLTTDERARLRELEREVRILQHAELAAQGIRVSRRRVARLMAELGALTGFVTRGGQELP
jgi:transposase-like protein